MNEAYELLLKRRTVRAFRSDPIPKETLEKILLAARYAPSAIGLQNRFFTIVQNRALMERIVAAAGKNGGTFRPGHTPFYNAPAVAVVSAPADFRYNREDAACAIQNILLAAEALGLGSCYICSVLPGLRDPEIMAELKLPEGYVPCGCVSLGFAAAAPEAPKPRRENDTAMIL